MYYSKKKNVKNRLLFSKKEKVGIVFRYIFFNLINRFKLKKESNLFSKILAVWQSLRDKNFLKFNSKTRLRRRCNISNRNRGSYRSFGGLSRIVVKDFIHSGVIPGYKKAVW